MRLKTYSADSMREAMRQIRADLGAEAIIVSTQRAGKGVRVTAACDAPPPEAPAAGALPRLHALLAAHAVPEPLRLRLLEAAEPRAHLAIEALLTDTLAAVMRFAPLADKAERPLLLIGPPGAGKTALAGRLAARAWAERAAVRVITTDLVRAGGREQLKTYTGALGIGLRSAADAVELKAALADAGRVDRVVIDTTGLNPFDKQERAGLAAIREAAAAEPILVLPCDIDPALGREFVAALAPLGCRRLIATRLDIARRLGGVLALLADTGLALAGATASARIADGSTDGDAPALAQHLLTLAPAESDASPRLQEAAA